MQLCRQVGMQTCPEVLKEPSKRRWCSQEFIPMVFPGIHTTTCQATRPASTATESQQVQERHLLHANRRSREGCRECVHEVDNVSEDKSSVRQRIRTKTDRTATSSLPSWAVCGPMMDRARGARGPLTLRLAGTPERRNERNTEQPKSYPFLLVGSNRQTKSPVGLQKGNILPKMGSVSFSMSDSR